MSVAEDITQVRTATFEICEPLIRLVRLGLYATAYYYRWLHVTLLVEVVATQGPPLWAE